MWQLHDWEAGTQILNKTICWVYCHRDETPRSDVISLLWMQMRCKIQRLQERNVLTCASITAAAGLSLHLQCDTSTCCIASHCFASCALLQCCTHACLWQLITCNHHGAKTDSLRCVCKLTAHRKDPHCTPMHLAFCQAYWCWFLVFNSTTDIKILQRTGGSWMSRKRVPKTWIYSYLFSLCAKCHKQQTQQIAAWIWPDWWRYPLWPQSNGRSTFSSI